MKVGQVGMSAASFNVTAGYIWVAQWGDIFAEVAALFSSSWIFTIQLYPKGTILRLEKHIFKNIHGYKNVKKKKIDSFS